jgi:hypothetical protein
MRGHCLQLEKKGEDTRAPQRASAVHACPDIHPLVWSDADATRVIVIEL